MALGSGDLWWFDDDGPVAPCGALHDRVIEREVSSAQETAWTRRGYAHAPDIASPAPSVEAAFDYCREVAKAVARTFYYGSLFLPASKRRATWAIYAFCRTADDIADEPDVFPEPVTELDRWRQDLRATYAGAPRGPVMTAWADMLRSYAVPIEPALELLRGVAMDIAGARYDTFEELRVYCYRVAGTVGLLLAPVLGLSDPDGLKSAEDLGIAMQLTNILRDVGEDARNRRLYLPREDMERFGVSEDDVQRGVVTPGFRALMRFEMDRTEEHYARGLAGIRLLSQDARLAIQLSGDLYRAILERIRRNEYDVFSRRAHVSLAGKLAALPGAWRRSQRR
jgi:phytoene synthase